MPIKVLFVGNYDIAVHNIRPEAEAIIGLKQQGLDVEVMTKGECWYAKRMESSGIRIHDYTPPGKFSFEAIFAAAWLVVKLIWTCMNDIIYRYIQSYYMA